MIIIKTEVDMEHPYYKTPEIRSTEMFKTALSFYSVFGR